MKATSPAIVTPSHAAHVTTSDRANQQYGLTLPTERLVLVTTDVPGLTSAAQVHPFNDHELVAEVQQLLVLDEGVAMQVVVDLPSRNAGRFFAQGIMNGFLLVLTDESGQSARVVTVQTSLLMAGDPIEAAGYFRNLKPTLNQTHAYVCAVAQAAWHGCGDYLSQCGSTLDPNQIHYRPVFNKDHVAALGKRSLADLIKSGGTIPTLSEFFHASMSALHGPGISFKVTSVRKAH